MLLDDDWETGVRTNAELGAFVQATFPHAVTATSVTVGSLKARPYEHDSGSLLHEQLTLQRSTDGVHWVGVTATVNILPTFADVNSPTAPEQFMRDRHRNARTFGFIPTTARYWRVALRSTTAEGEVSIGTLSFGCGDSTYTMMTGSVECLDRGALCVVTMDARPPHKSRGCQYCKMKSSRLARAAA